MTKETEKEVDGEIPMGNDDKDRMGAGTGTGRNKVEMSIFGFKFQDLSTEVKYMISFAFIALIFLGISYGLKVIKSFDRQVKSKAKKDKKNK